MYETIPCPCGVAIVKNYFQAQVIGTKYEPFYYWMCEFCGRGYKEARKSPEDITPKYNGYGHTK